ncbi:MAG: PQQ-binding-like beta-propeller repeat protein [Gemmataceae bacterium]
MRSLLGLCVIVLATTSVVGDDWPQFLGPQRDGISREKGLLKAWPEGGPKLAWKVQSLGLGYSCPVVAGGRIYTLGTRDFRLEGNRDFKIVGTTIKTTCLICLDEKTGEDIWYTPFAAIETYFDGNTYGNGPRGAPAVDGKNIYALSGDGTLACFGTETGAIEWKVNLVKDFGGETMSKWGGYSQSVLVDGDNVICVPGGKKGAVLALNKETGKKVWQTAKITDKATFASVIKAKICGTDQYVVLTYTNYTTGGSCCGISPEGEVLWYLPRVTGSSEEISTTPLVKDDKIYVTYGEGTRYGSRLIHVTKKGDKLEAAQVYNSRGQRNLANRYGGVVLVGDFVFGINRVRQYWTCQDFASGRRMWDDNRRLRCQSSGSLVATADRLYLLTDRGEMALIETSDRGWKEHGRLKIPETSKLRKTLRWSLQAGIWTYPVIANGRLYIRDHELLLCYDIKK